MVKVFHFGVNEEKEVYKKPVIVLSNQITVLQLILGGVLAYFCYHSVPELFYLPLGFIGGLILVIILTFIGLNDIARFLLIFTNALFLSLLHAFPLKAGDPYIIHLYLAQFSLVIMPWVIIDLREGYFIYLATLLVLLFFFAQPIFIESFTLDINREIFETGIIKILTYLSILIGVTYLLYLFSSYISNNIREILDNENEITEKTHEMEQRQQDLQIKINEIQETQKVEENRSWVAKNITEISDIIRGSKQENIFTNLAEEMVKILNAQQVAIYTVEEVSEKSQYLKPESCYAIDRHKFLEKKLAMGEGLVGQCCKDREILFIDNLPESHLRFTTGLGDEPPKNLALIPLIENENLSGVLEIASVHKFEKREKEFLKQVAEIIASFIIANKLNVKIQELIQQNQVQAEEMKAQEEEMMQNMEELQATQEEMSRKEKEYLEKIEILESKLADKEQA